MAKQTVLILGATGFTGSSILEALLDSDNFTAAAGVRPASASKPEVNELKTRGVEIRIMDIQNWTVDRITESLKGIDTLISTIYALDVLQQKPLVDAAKRAGVKRFIPDDWATACVRGIRRMHDSKREIHDYIEKAGLGYTFIDVGWWMQLLLTPTDPSKADYPAFVGLIKKIYGTGDVKSAVIDRRDIGKFVKRIISDDRTLNRYVFCWTEHVTQNEAVALAERVTGRKFEIESVSEEQLLRKIKHDENGSTWHMGEYFNKEQLLHTVKQVEDGPAKHMLEYFYTMYIRGDNTVENAKKPEYGSALDARKLYPEIGKELRSLEDFAKELYLS